MRLLMLVVAAAALTPMAARADHYVIPPPQYQGDNGREISTQIVRELHRIVSAQDQVTLPKEAARQLPKAQRVWCATGDCVERYREAAKATAAIVVRVYRIGAEGPATSFQIGLQPEPELEYSEGAILDSRVPLSEQVARTWVEVQRKYRRGPGPHLHVTGAPEKAQIYVDGRPMGSVPEFLTLSVGTHHVRVEGAGFEPQDHVVALQSASAFEQLEVRLEPARARASLQARRNAPAPSVASPSRSLRLERRARLAVGMTTAGAAAALSGLTLSAWSLGRKDDSCDTPLCDQQQQSTDWKIARGVGLGTLALGAVGIAWGVWQLRKTRLDVQTHRGGASLSLRGQF